MASLQIRDVDPALVAGLKQLARRERRTLSQQVLHVLERHLEQTLGRQTGLAAIADRLEHVLSGADDVAMELELPSREEAGRKARVAAILDATG